MNSRTEPAPHTSPSVPLWHAEGQTERIAHVVTADNTLQAVVIDNLSEPGQALCYAQQMAASGALLFACEVAAAAMAGKPGLALETQVCRDAAAQARGAQP